MIVTRRPCTIYDVDVVGSAVLAVLGLAAWLLVAAPWQRTWRTYRELRTQQTVAEQRLQNDVVDGERYQRELADLEQLAHTQASQVPCLNSLPQLLSKMTAIAKDAHVELLNVAPQPALTDGAYLVSDIRIVGRGTSHDFLYFLDRLAQDNPYQSLRTCSIARSVAAPEPTCELNWAVRLYMFPLADPPASTSTAGSAPASAGGQP
jgi:Tfp pilus assembly protein PilO